MKAILVIDKTTCEECPCYHEDRSVCQAGGLYGKPCPLRPMPLKRETHVYWKSVGIGNIPTHEITDYDKGWNDCVEFLEGSEYADK